MPKNTHHAAIARLIEILKKIPSRGSGMTARELTDWLRDEGYDVNKRTVERDLDELATHFPLYCNDKSKPYGWLWAQDATPDLPGVDLPEAMSLHLVEELLRPLLPKTILDSLAPRFRQARKKLKSLVDANPNARWLDKVRYVSPALPLLPPKIADGVLEIVQDCLLKDLQIDVSYQSLESEAPQSMRLHPLGLVQRGPLSYLVATIFNYTDVRLLAVHRIHEARQRDEAAHRPAGFSLDDYIGHGALNFGNGKTICLKAKVEEWLAAVLSETPLTEDQQMKEYGGELVVSATVNDTWQLRWWILSQGAGIAVLEPAVLRKEIGRVLKRAARGY